jgi:hypothetical protein
MRIAIRGGGRRIDEAADCAAGDAVRTSRHGKHIVELGRLASTVSTRSATSRGEGRLRTQRRQSRHHLATIIEHDRWPASIRRRAIG